MQYLRIDYIRSNRVFGQCYAMVDTYIHGWEDPTISPTAMMQEIMLEGFHRASGDPEEWIFPGAVVSAAHCDSDGFSINRGSNSAV